MIPFVKKIKKQYSLSFKQFLNELRILIMSFFFLMNWTQALTQEQLDANHLAGENYIT